MDSAETATTPEYTFDHAENRYGVVFRRDFDFNEAVQRIKPLIDEQFKEVSQFKETELPYPNWDYYYQLYTQNALRFFNIRSMESEDIQGYYLAWITQHHHYKDVTVSYSDLIYVKPEYRGWVAYKFIKWVDARLKEDRVKYNIWACNPELDFKPMAKRLGYKTLNIQYIKEL